jgi:hypothetical protein
MSRAGRGGGRGGFGGRNTFGANNPPPMGLTFADIQAISREQSALYPVRLHSPSCTFTLTVLRIIVHSLSSLFRHLQNTPKRRRIYVTYSAALQLDCAGRPIM